nr:hypothetical protein BdHM001_10080 [Bdellovibrio sp. HM001]
MKLTLFIVSIILGGPVFAESDFVSNHFIDRPYTEAAKKYKNAPWETPCGKEFSAYCKETGLKCECRQLNLASGPTFGRMLGFYIGNGSVLGYVDVSTVRGTFGLDKVLGTAKSFFGDVKPTEMYDFSSRYSGYHSLFLVWKLEKGFSTGLALCPLEQVAGATKVTSKVRDCFVSDARIYRYGNLKMPPQVTGKSKLEY